MSSDSVIPLNFTASLLFRSASRIICRQANDVLFAIPHSSAALADGQLVHHTVGIHLPIS